MDNHFDRRERTIYVWMLERSVTDDELYSLFSKIGPIEKLIFKEYADGTPQHCLIVFRYVDSVLTAMSTLQGAELNGKPISLRPLRESTHAVLMPGSMYPSTSLSLNGKERKTTVTSSDGLSDHSDEQHNYNKKYAVGKKTRSKWDAPPSAGSASSAIWNGDGLETAMDKLTMDDRRGGTIGARSSASYSSISSASGSPSHSLSSPSQLPQQQQHAAIHGSLRKPWRPSRGPIPAPLLTSGVGSLSTGTSRYLQHEYMREEYGGGGGAYAGHTNVAHHSAGVAPPPPSLFSQMIPPSPGYGSPSPYDNHEQKQSHQSSFFSGGVSAHSPRPLFPDLYKPAARNRGSYQATPLGVFSPTAAREEVLWRAQPPPPPPPSLMSPPCTAGPGHNWFDYGEYSVPQAYRGSGTEQQFAAAAAAETGGLAPSPPPFSLGGMLPPNSPPIGQCTRFFDFTEGCTTLPRLRVPPHLEERSSLFPLPPSSARPHALSPWTDTDTSTRCTPKPRSAAPHHNIQHHNSSPFNWPEFRPFSGRF